MEATKRLAHIELNQASDEIANEITKSLILFPAFEVMVAKRNFFANYISAFMAEHDVSDEAIVIISGLIKTDFSSLNNFITRAEVMEDVKMALAAREEILESNIA